jgi:hypothetical protein
VQAAELTEGARVTMILAADALPSGSLAKRDDFT